MIYFVKSLCQPSLQTHNYIFPLHGLKVTSLGLVKLNSDLKLNMRYIKKTHLYIYQICQILSSIVEDDEISVAIVDKSHKSHF